MLRAFAKFATFVFVTLAYIPIYFIWPRKNKSHQHPLVHHWYKLVLSLLGIQVTIKNIENLSPIQKIYLSNHISYLDIIILGGTLDCFFVAKADVRKWPFFGYMAKLADTIFISRKRQHVKTQSQLLNLELERGKSLLIFPEGTTSNGQQILNFKTGLLNGLVRKNVVFQPISLVYRTLNGNPLKLKTDFDKIAWYGEMTLLPHLWQIFAQKRIEATVTIHAPLTLSDQDIKTFIRDIQNQVEEGFYPNLAVQ